MSGSDWNFYQSPSNPTKQTNHSYQSNIKKFERSLEIDILARERRVDVPGWRSSCSQRGEENKRRRARRSEEKKGGKKKERREQDIRQQG